MLAAACLCPERATTFRLALILSSQGKEAPEKLVLHFNEILRQAKSLLSRDGEKPLEILPEAAEVAFEIKINESLASELDALTDYQMIDSHKASVLLEKLNSTHSATPSSER